MQQGAIRSKLSQWEYLNSSAIWTPTGGIRDGEGARPATRIELTYPRRMEMRLFDACVAVAHGELDVLTPANFPPTEFTEWNLCHSHRRREFVCGLVMKENARGVGDEGKLFIPKRKGNRLTQDCTLVRGSLLLGAKTAHGIFNAAYYRLTDWKVERPEEASSSWQGPIMPTLVIKEVRYGMHGELDDTGEIEIPYDLFHSLLRPGGCATFSSSQGKTVRGKLTLWEVNGPFTSREERYVGMSRATHWYNLQVVDDSRCP